MVSDHRVPGAGKIAQRHTPTLAGLIPAFEHVRVALGDQDERQLDGVAFGLEDAPHLHTGEPADNVAGTAADPPSGWGRPNPRDFLDASDDRQRRCAQDRKALAVSTGSSAGKQTRPHDPPNRFRRSSSQRGSCPPTCLLHFSVQREPCFLFLRPIVHGNSVSRGTLNAASVPKRVQPLTGIPSRTWLEVTQTRARSLGRRSLRPPPRRRHSWRAVVTRLCGGHRPA